MEDIYWFWLTSVFDMDVINLNMILEKFGTPENIFKLKEETLIKSGIKDRIVNKIISSKNEKEIMRRFKELSEFDIKFTHFGQEEFPDFEALGEVRPRALYYKGRLPEKDEDAIAMVGARKCSLYGKNMSLHLAGQAVEWGLSVVSGLAMGIDEYSHRGALEKGGMTYAVLAGGVENCYPAMNKYLYDRILNTGGGIISEYPPGTSPVKIRFPMRNRIISGLSKSLIVVEAKKKSGSLITANCALEQGKDVYAVPGRAGDLLSEGCNELIKEGAGLITDIGDMFVQEKFTVQENTLKYGTLEEKEKENFNKIENMGLAKDLQVLYSNVHWRPEPIEVIAVNSGFDVVEALRMIMVLQLKGLVKEVMRNYYSRV